MKTWLKWVLPLVAVAVGLSGMALMIHFSKAVKLEQPISLPPRIQTVTALTTNHPYRIHTQGTVEPLTHIELTAEVSGRVLRISTSLESGGFFEEGDTLVHIDPRDFELAVIQAQARVEDARLRLQLEEAEAAVAAKEWRRLGSGEANELLLRKPQLAQARATLAAAEASLEQARRDLARCDITAPFAGRVGAKRVDTGQFIAKGTPVARIYSVDFAEVRLPLSADQLAYVEVPLAYRGDDRPGHHPVVLLRASMAGRTHRWEGHIDRVEGEIDTRTRMLFVVARVADPYGRAALPDRPPLASGLFVEAEILGLTASNVVVLPRTALRGSNTVLVRDADHRLWPRQVRVARAGRQEVVIAGGLEAGDIICISALDIFTEGMRVRTEDEPASAAPGPGSEDAQHE